MQWSSENKKNGWKICSHLIFTNHFLPLQPTVIITEVEVLNWYSSNSKKTHILVEYSTKKNIFRTSVMMFSISRVNSCKYSRWISFTLQKISKCEKFETVFAARSWANPRRPGRIPFYPHQSSLASNVRVQTCKFAVMFFKFSRILIIWLNFEENRSYRKTVHCEQFPD